MSYLNGRNQCVFVDGKYSNNKIVTKGVPQGSILGPILFTVYLLPLYGLLKSMNIPYHIYADDVAIFIKFNLSSILDSLWTADTVFCQIYDLLSTLRLKVNSNKTQCMVVSNEHKANFPKTLTLNHSKIDVGDHLKILGVTLDSKVSLRQYVNSVCSSCYHQLRKIQSVRKFLTPTLTKLLILTFVISRLDYGNAIFVDLPNYLLNKLQLVQNRSARLIFYV